MKDKELDKREVAVEEKAVVYITLDKPFVYMIIDNETGLPVFMGTCNDIK